MTAKSHTAYIGLGSNLGEPLVQLRRARAALDKLESCAVEQCSGLYSSAAIGPGEQPDYLNAVLQLRTQLSPRELLNAMRQIEEAQGRTRVLRWGARTLDLDLLLFDKCVIASKDLCVPHPRLHERNFVVYPLFEIAPTLCLPDGQALSELAQQLPAAGLQLTTHDL